MIRLDTVNRSLTLFLGGAQVTAPLQIVVSYSDQTSTTYLGSTQLANSNGTTPVTICSAPIASVIRDIDMVTVLNTDSATQTVTIQLLDTATTLLVGDKLTYTHGSAWQVVNNSGNIKYTVLATTGVDSFSGGSTGLTPATATTGIVTLGGTLAVASGGTGTATPALVAGTNVTITGTWPNQTVNATNSGTVTSVAALTLGTTGTDVSSTVANSTTTPVITLNLPTASATNRGALSAADWTTFNSKGSGTVTSVSGTTGRITSTGGTTPVLDLTSGIATPGTTGSASLIPVVTIDTYGRVTSITTAANPQGTVTSVTGTSPISSSGGATPAISLDASYGDTQNPYASKTANYVLAAPNGSAGVPTFRDVVAADIPTLNQSTTGNAATATTATNIAGGANLQIPFNTGSGATSFIVAPTITSTFLQYNGTGFVWAASTGIGTVTSVAASVPSFLSITGSPITTAGTLAISYSGTALPIANGGTGQTTAAAAFNALSPITTTGDLIIGNGTNSATRLGIGTNGYVLKSNGTTASWATSGGGAGSVLQVVSTTKTDAFSTTSTSYVDITGLSVSITPTSNTSKILVILSISGSEQSGWGYQLLRGSTAICIGDSGGGSRKQASGGMSVRDTNGINNGSVNFLDSPATTSSTTYKVQMYVPSSTGYVNRTYGDVDASYTARTASTITVMEIAG